MILNEKIDALKDISFRKILNSFFEHISKNKISLRNYKGIPSFNAQKKELKLNIDEIKKMNEKSIQKFNLTFLEMLHEFAHIFGPKIRKKIFFYQRSNEEAIAEMFCFLVIQKLNCMNAEYHNHVYDFLEKYKYDYDLCWREAFRTYKKAFN